MQVYWGKLENHIIFCSTIKINLTVGAVGKEFDVII